MTKHRGGGGFGGGGGMNPGNMGKMLQKMQADMLAAQQALETETVEVVRNGITIVITGHQRVQSVTIDPKIIDTSDEEWLTDLQDLLVVAVNEAIEQSQAMAAQRMESITGGLGGIPWLGRAAVSKAVPEPVTRLIDALSRLPGVGPKTASRLTYYLLRAPDELSQSLAEALGELKSQTKFCSVCFNITVEDPCPICADSSRDHRTIAAVEEPLDVLAIERTGVYTGVYHVLHGAISPVNGIGPDDIRIGELVARVEKGGVSEVVIATNPGLEGDATAMYIQRELAPKGVRLTRLARGLPVGGDIEYADTVTLMRALQGRSEL